MFKFKNQTTKEEVVGTEADLAVKVLCLPVGQTAHLYKQREDGSYAFFRGYTSTIQGLIYATFCSCGSQRPAGYYEYGPEHGWPHCPDCGMV